MIVKPARGERFVEAPDPGIAAVLLYGPNRGLVRDRGERLGRAAVGSLDDPFRVADLAPAVVADDPARLVDEAAALSMTGGRRLVRVRGAGNEVAPACAALLESAGDGALVVVEAGPLERRSRLRTLFEAADNAAAIACYDDDEAALRGVVRDRLAEHGKTATPAASEVLLARLGADRKATLGELDKLALYVGDAPAIDDGDVLACVGDAADATLDDLADAAASGDRSRAGRALDKLAADGVSPVRVLAGLQRHFQRLHLAAGRVRDGASPHAAVGALRPPVFFRRRASVAAQLARWSPSGIARAMEVLLAAEIACKTTGAPAAVVCAHAVMRIAQAGRRGGRHASR